LLQIIFQTLDCLPADFYITLYGDPFRWGH
jgi:hypothetical protein